MRRPAFAPDRHPQRQRHVDRAPGRRHVGLPPGWRRAAPTSRCARPPSSSASSCPRRSTSAPPRRKSMPARSWSAAARCSRRWASTMSARGRAQSRPAAAGAEERPRRRARPDPAPRLTRKGRATPRPRPRPTGITAWSSSTWSRGPGQGQAERPGLYPRVRREPDQRGDADDKVVAITAAMPAARHRPVRQGASGQDLRRRHRRAARGDVRRRPGDGGYRPFVAIYSIPAAGYDQVVHDVALQNLPVRFCLDRPAGRRRRGDPCRGLRPGVSVLPAEHDRDGGSRRGRAGAHGGDGARA